MTELDKDNFDAAVLAHKGVYLVDFWSETCETCIDDDARDRDPRARSSRGRSPSAR